jgi:hypothetical protein
LSRRESHGFDESEGRGPVGGRSLEAETKEEGGDDGRQLSMRVSASVVSV